MKGSSLSMASGLWLRWLAGLGVLAHAIAIHCQALPYTTDELQYVAWSQALDWGYFSKPPGIAAALWLWSFADPQAIALRFLSQICYGLSLLICFNMLRDDGFSPSTAFTALLLLASMPMIGFAQWFFTTDALLLMCWLCALTLAWRALAIGNAHNAMRRWVVLGFVIALGVLCKHSMVFFWLGLLIYMRWMQATSAAQWRGLALCFLVFTLSLTPHMIWLLDHPGTTLRHLADLQGIGSAFEPEGTADAQAAVSLIEHLLQAFEFIAVQWLGLGLAVLLLLRRQARWSPLQRWLLAQSVPVLGLFVLQAGLSRAYANWALPATFTLGLALLAHFLNDGKAEAFGGLSDESARPDGHQESGAQGEAVTTRLGLWLVSNLLLSLFISFGAQGLKLIRPDAGIWIDRIDAFHRQRGWDEFNRALLALQKPASVPWVVSDRDAAARILQRFGEAQLLYRPMPGAKPNHYALRYPFGDSITQAATQQPNAVNSRSCTWSLMRNRAPDDPRQQLLAQVQRPRLSGRTETWFVTASACD
ncbi:MAG: hypothetical protein EBX62_04125 [Betaproteobacteria bacterium]|nr:hypothetical protein [Betaproteobacteria bacterium]